MIVCSCNILTDHDVRKAVSASGFPFDGSRFWYGAKGSLGGRAAHAIDVFRSER